MLFMHNGVKWLKQANQASRPADRAVPSTRVARACSSSKKLELYFRARAPLEF